MQDNRFVLAKIGRQLGKTISVACYILHSILFNDVYNVCIMANKGSAAREVLSRIQFAYEYLPEWLQQGVKTWNKGNIELENKSSVYTAATTISGPRGKSINMLYVDEAAIIPNNIFDEFYASSYPTISSGKETKVVMTSTPLGYNHFWKLWNDAENKRNNYVTVEAHWSENPDRDQKWADEQLKQLKQLKFNQEVLCHWLGSSATLIDANTLGSLSAMPPIFSKDGLDVFEYPVRRVNDHDNIYVLVADTSKGGGNDYSAFSVVDITSVPYRLVARFRDCHMSPLIFPNLIYKVATEYNNAYVLLETNSCEQVAYILHNEFEYENILQVRRTQRGQEVGGGFGNGGVMQFGVNTDKKVKRHGCFNLKSLLEEKKLLVFDEIAIAELSTFVEVKQSFAADEGYNDDVVMTLVLFAWLTTQDFFRDVNNIDIRKALYDQQMENMEQALTPFGFIIDGREEETLANF